MSTLFLSLFLIIFVLCFVTMRIFVPKFYNRQQSYDSLAILPVIILLVSFLLLNAFGLSHSILIAILLTFFIFLVNLRRFYNLCIGLNRDDYYPLFKIVSIFQNILLIVFLIALLIYFPPLLQRTQTETHLFYGSHKAGFFEKTSLLEKTTAKLEIYPAYISQDNKESTNTNVIYLPDIYSTTYDSQGTLNFLADKGYNVFAFTFFDKLNYFNNFKDLKTFSPFFMRYENKNDKQNIEKNKEMFIHQKTTEFTSILTLLESKNQLPVYILAEGNCIPAAEEIQQKFPQAILGIYKINVDDKIEGYIDGYANLQQTRPLESAILKLPQNRTWDNAKRIAFFADKKFTTYETYQNLQLTKEEE